VLWVGDDRLAKQLFFIQLSNAAPTPASHGARRLLDSYINDASPPLNPSAALRLFALGLVVVVGCVCVVVWVCGCGWVGGWALA
jgi:hypothetical protein